MQDGNTSVGEADEFDWNTEDELEIASYALPSCSNGTLHGGESVASSTKVCVKFCFLVLPVNRKFEEMKRKMFVFSFWSLIIKMLPFFGYHKEYFIVLSKELVNDL